MKFKKTQILPKASKVTIKQIMSYTKEDLEQVTADQPCMRGDLCLQQIGGIHSRVCRAEIAEIEALIEQGSGQLWREQVEEQEEYNNDPMNGFLDYQKSHRYDYDYDYALRQGEQEREGDTNN